MITPEQTTASHDKQTEGTALDTSGEVVAAESYDSATEEGGWDSPERAQRLVEQYVGDGSVVLDIGIGTGQAVKGYSEKGAAIIGLDHDPEMLAMAQSVTGESGSMREADINNPLPVGDIVNRVDVAQAIGVLEFASDLPNVLDQVKSTLKPGGIFVFTVEATVGDNDSLAHYYPDADLTLYRHTADEVRELLDKKDFILLHDEAYDGYARGDTETGKVPYHIFLAQSGEAQGSGEIARRLEAEHYVKLAPRFADQLKDVTRTNGVTYIAGRGGAIGTVASTSDPEYSASRRILTEHEMLTRTNTFIDEACTYLEKLPSDEDYYDMREDELRSLKSIQENLTFIGEKEYEEATKGIADYWKALLETNPKQQILVVTGEIARRYGKQEGKIKSDDYALEHILAHFSDDEEARFKERLVMNPGDVTVAGADDLRVVLLDDWTISGDQLNSAVEVIRKQFPQFVPSLEIQLLVATEERINEGFRVNLPYGGVDTTSAPIPVRAYYKAHHVESGRKSSEAHITGFHSSVDYNFEDDIVSFVDYIRNESVEPALPILQEMPPMTNIVRPYRQEGFSLTQKARFRE